MDTYLIASSGLTLLAPWLFLWFLKSIPSGRHFGVAILGFYGSIVLLVVLLHSLILSIVLTLTSPSSLPQWVLVGHLGYFLFLWVIVRKGRLLR